MYGWLYVTSPVQLSYYITITNTGLLLLEFISMYLIAVHPPTLGGRHCHLSQATRLSFLNPHSERINGSRTSEFLGKLG